MSGTRTVIEAFWQCMQDNDWAGAAQLFSPGFELIWPQSGERFDAEGFVAVNSQYPAEGRWRFDVTSVLVDGSEAVSRVEVTDGNVRATVISYFAIEQGRIAAMTEFWPEPYDPPVWRKGLSKV